MYYSNYPHINCDVAIVGAGPAGSTAAKFLSEQGYNVLLIEKNKFPRDKPCGGGLTKRVLEEFNFINNRSFISSYSYGGILHSPSLKFKVEVIKDEPQIGMVSRKDFDFKLAKLAVKNGTMLIDNKEVIDIKNLKDHVEIFLDDGGIIKSKILIGADGVWSLIAKKTGLREKSIDYGICIVEEFNVEQKVLNKFFGKNRICCYYSQPQNINGYGWVFPKKECLNIGIVEFIIKNKKNFKHNLLEIFLGYIKILKKNNMIPDFINVKNFKGGAIPMKPLDKTYLNRVILIGDSAGFSNALTGEGLYYALKSGKIAAEVIDKALKSGDTSESFLSKYQAMWEKDFGKDLNLFYKVRKKLGSINSKFFRIVNSDNILKELYLGIGLGTISPNQYRWKLLKRYFYASLKYKIKKFN
jgi:geranylgeranyl reductase family protein